MARLMTGLVRFSYVTVFEPKAMSENDTPKYSVSILIPKTDVAQIGRVKKAIVEAIEEGKAKKFGGKVPANLRTPLRDGDLERPGDDAYAGCMFFNANTQLKPQVVDANLNRIDVLTREEFTEQFYSGCYGRATINFYAFDFRGTKGIAAGLGNLQKLADGERLAGGASAESEFGSEPLPEDDPLM